MKVQPSHRKDDWKNIRISDVDLSVRTSNCLYNMGLVTLGDLAEMSEDELLRQPNFGKKCLTEVRNLSSSTAGFALGDKLTVEEATLDFSLISEPLLSKLLRQVQTLDLNTKARNAIGNFGIVTVGELAQMTKQQLRRMPSVGNSTINNFEVVLSELGLSLGTTIMNWPERDEIRDILESRTQSKIDQTSRSVGKFDFLEDELCAAVRMTIDDRGYAIVMRRTGWDGGSTLTLEELGNDPVVSGRRHSITRERVRQIEVTALNKVQKKAWSMPLLERAVSLIEENAPLAAASVQGVLERHQLSRRGLEFEALAAAMKTFQVEWSLIGSSVGQELFLFPPNKAGTMEAVWTSMVMEADRRDFVSVEKFEDISQRSIDFVPDLVELGVSRVSALDWLDRHRRIFWSRDRASRGRNNVVNVCRKILTVAPNIPFQRLATAVERTRTITDCPSSDTLMGIIRGIDDVDIHDGVVSRGSSFAPAGLNNSDKLMINAAKDTGTVTTFSKLREALVRLGVSTGYAQILIVKSPLWITSSRGNYRFIADKAQLGTNSIAASTEEVEPQESGECLVEFETSHRHLVTGTHRIDEDLAKSGRWSLRDEQDIFLGEIDVTANTIKGLKSVFATAKIEVGTFVIIDFSDQQFSATLYY